MRDGHGTTTAMTSAAHAAAPAHRTHDGHRRETSNRGRRLPRVGLCDRGTIILTALRSRTRQDRRSRRNGEVFHRFSSAAVGSVGRDSL